MDRNETDVQWFTFGDNDTVFFIDKRWLKKNGMSGIQVVAAGAKFNLRRGNGSSHNVVNGYSSDGDLCRINKSGCFSSAVEVDRDPSCVSFTIVNILAPIYKRIDPQASLLWVSKDLLMRFALTGCVNENLILKDEDWTERLLERSDSGTMLRVEAYGGPLIRCWNSME
ncbi:hypothetical protein JHK87_024653 [Glycine soja]|nr:hypothetical protein JHK87_024653 [Glycine soja]